MESYFKTAPCTTWKDWAWGMLPLQKEKEPYLLPHKLSPELKSNFKPTLIESKIEVARELSEFLGSYYYDTSSNYNLVVSPRFILHLLETRQMIGLEIRHETKIIACIFEFFMGLYGINNEKRVGLISWLCVDPKWRKKGLTNLLCHTITYKTPTAAEIKWFRNDALFRSPLPPIYSSKIMDREIRHTQSPFVKKQNFKACKDEFISLWKKDNPKGVVFDSPVQVATQLMIWGFEKEDKGLWALVQPTYEVKKEKAENTKHGCEILQIVSYGFKDWYEKIQIFEMIVDALPFDYCECSVEVPHIESLWTVRGISTWSAVGLHPGNPFQRPVLSLVAS